MNKQPNTPKESIFDILKKLQVVIALVMIFVAGGSTYGNLSSQVTQNSDYISKNADSIAQLSVKVDANAEATASDLKKVQEDLQKVLIGINSNQKDLEWLKKSRKKGE